MEGVALSISRLPGAIILPKRPKEIKKDLVLDVDTKRFVYPVMQKRRAFVFFFNLSR
jgi:hypothetical protein